MTFCPWFTNARPLMASISYNNNIIKKFKSYKLYVGMKSKIFDSINYLKILLYKNVWKSKTFFYLSFRKCFID